MAILANKVKKKKPVADVIKTQAAKKKVEAPKAHFHYSQTVEFPYDGVTVQASSLDNWDRITKPDWGLYASTLWKPLWRAEFITWDDFGIPSAYEAAFDAIEYAYDLAEAGKLVEVGCMGGHGRTGTILACMAVLDGLDHKDAIAFIRSRFCKDAIETAEQEWYVEWFECHLTDSVPSEKPKGNADWIAEYYKEKENKSLDSTGQIGLS